MRTYFADLLIESWVRLSDRLRFTQKHPIKQRVFIHIGKGKTGTTAIQRFLSRHLNLLYSQNIHYIRVGGGLRGIGHQDFAKSFLTVLPRFMSPPLYSNGNRESILREIKKSTSENIVISSENFEIVDPKQVFDFFKPIMPEYEFKIIFFVRSQDELAESEYNQVVKVRGLTSSFYEYINEHIQACNYMETASKWEEYFGTDNIICRVHDASKSNAIEQFLSCIMDTSSGYQSASFLHDIRKTSNMSLGYRALSIIHALNNVDIQGRSKLYQRLFKVIGKNDLPALHFNSEEARVYRNRFAESNKAFTAKFLGEALSDLGGRKHSDQDRDQIRRKIISMGLNFRGLSGESIG